MPVMLPKSLIVLVPKTGTRWCMRAISKSQLPFTVVGEIGRWSGTMTIHAGLNNLALEVIRRHDNGKRRFIFGFVRHPLTWIGSIWAHFTRAVGARKHFPRWIRQNYDKRLHTFVGNLIRSGCADVPSNEILGRLGYRREKHTWEQGSISPDFVGKVENFPHDFITAMNRAEEEINTEDVLELPPLFQNPLRRSAEQPYLYEAGIMKKLYEVNRQLYEMFGYEEVPL